MKAYPLHAPRHHYSGTDKRKRERASEWNAIAREVVDHINSDLSKVKDDHRTYSANSVAAKIGRDTETVRDVLNAIDGGHNGITCCNGDWQKTLREAHRKA